MAQASVLAGPGLKKLGLTGSFQAEPSRHITNHELSSPQPNVEQPLQPNDKQCNEDEDSEQQIFEKE